MCIRDRHSIPADKQLISRFADAGVNRVLVGVSSVTPQDIFEELEQIAKTILGSN